MSDLVLLIELVGGSPDATNSLMAWLQRGTGAVVRARTLPDRPGPPSAPVLIVQASPGIVPELAGALLAWMKHQRSEVDIQITRDDRTVRISSGTRPDTVNRHLDELLVATGTNVTAGNGDSFWNSLGNFAIVPARYGASGSPRAAADGDADESTVPVTIFLSEERIHAQVETAVNKLLATAGLAVQDRDEPVIGSWFRQMRAAAKEVTRSPAAREAALTAAHAADTRLVLAQDAAVTATLLQNLGPVIASLQPTKDAVLRVGALLIVKVDWVVNVFQLTAAQQTLLDHRPQLASSPYEIISSLDLTIGDQGGHPPKPQ